MQEEHAGKIPDDEIDLTAIGKKIYALVTYPFVLLAANIKTTLVFLLAAVLLAFFLKYNIPKTYYSSFIIRPIDKYEKLHLKVLGDIQTLLKKRDYATIAGELNISPSVAAAIADLRTNNSTYKPSSDSINYTEVTIGTTDYNQFIPIQNSLVNYLERNPYFAKLKNLQIKQIAMSLEQVNKDLPQLDSLKKLQLTNYGRQQASTQNPILLNDLINPTAVYAMSIERQNKKSNLLAQEAFEDNFQVIKNCVVVKHHDWPPRVLVLCLYLVPLFLLLCLIFLIGRNQFMKRLKH
jgi:hypothetical protein